MLIAAPILYKPNFFLAERLTSTFMERYGITPNHQAASGYEAIKILAGLLQDERNHPLCDTREDVIRIRVYRNARQYFCTERRT